MSLILFIGLVLLTCIILALQFCGVKIDIGSVTGLLSVWIAAWSFYATNKENKEERVKSQAIEVCAWLLPSNESKDYKNFKSEKTNGGYTFIPRQVKIKNSSSTPIYDVYIFSMMNYNSDCISQLSNEFRYVTYKEMIYPGDSLTFVKTDGNAMGGKSPRVSIAFKDINGQNWYRGPQGKLKKVSSTKIESTLHNAKIFRPYSDGAILLNQKDGLS